MAYEADVERLTLSIQEREQVFEQLSDEQVKELANDTGTLYVSGLFLKKLKQGEWIALMRYFFIQVILEYDRRLHQQQQ